MALVSCPECGRKVSSLPGAVCPGCGCMVASRLWQLEQERERQERQRKIEEEERKIRKNPKYSTHYRYPIGYNVNYSTEVRSHGGGLAGDYWNEYLKQGSYLDKFILDGVSYSISHFKYRPSIRGYEEHTCDEETNSVVNFEPFELELGEHTLFISGKYYTNDIPHYFDNGYIFNLDNDVKLNSFQDIMTEENKQAYDEEYRNDEDRKGGILSKILRWF